MTKLFIILFFSWSAQAQVLDCKNLGDAIEATACEAGVHNSCEGAARGSVAHIFQIREHKPVKVQKVKALNKNSLYEVTFLQADKTKTSKVDVIREKKKCRVNKIY